MIKVKGGHKVKGSHPILYTTALDSLRKYLPDTVEPMSIATHSMRSGGATAAANKDVSDRLISKHSRWSTKGSRDRYIKDSKTKRFDTSKNLGL